MISAICWIPKGVAKSEPVLAEPPSKDDIQQIITTTLTTHDVVEDEEEEEAIEDDEVISQALAVAEAIGGGVSNSNKYDEIALALKDLDMDNYDHEDDQGVELFSTGIGDLYYPTNDLDPYLKRNKDEDEDDDDDDSEDLQDMIINPTDSVIVCARNEDDVSVLEVWVVEDTNSKEMNMFIHHEIIIPAFPLSTAWLDCPLKGGGDKGNFIAVGSMEPSIEIWDLDVIDEVQPCVILGGILHKNNKKGNKKSIKYKHDSHTDSVLSLAWNKEYRNILASASKALGFVNNQPSCIASKTPKTGAVFSISFSEDNPFLLAIGGSEGKLEVWDTLSESGISRRYDKYNKNRQP
ncbi:putative transcription factor WD40-like family [Lupinus albus]|uniref:Putative transcription factor WD40-like family n=1 Tax=Lupinus albus TaxID=3870 RepID=A0A6A4P1H7_LUPAL|nr:putative transcription factor WD40-like family [Lupinus albus]